MHTRPTELNRQVRNSGFTLVEIVITIAVVSILAGIAAVIILQGIKAYTAEQAGSDVHYQARLAVERIAREARLIQSCPSLTISSNPTGTLLFTDVNGAVVTFSYSTGNLLRNTNPLANGITSAQPFRFVGRDGATATTSCSSPNDIWFVDINVTDIQGSQALQIQTRVHPMNF